MIGQIGSFQINSCLGKVSMIGEGGLEGVYLRCSLQLSLW